MAHDRWVAIRRVGATALGIVLLGLLGMSSALLRSEALLVDTEESTGNTVTAVTGLTELSESQAYLSGATRGTLFWCQHRDFAGHLFRRHLVPDSYIDAGCILIRTEEELVAAVAGTWSPPNGVALSETRREACGLLVAAVLSSALENGAPLPEDASGYSVGFLMREALREGDDAAIERFATVLRCYLASGERIPIEQCDCMPESGQDAAKAPDGSLPLPNDTREPQATPGETAGDAGLVADPPAGEHDANPTPAPDPGSSEQVEPAPSGSPSTTVELES